MSSDGGARLAGRALLSLVAVAAVTGAGILRLGRVPRPRAAVLARYANGAVTVARVTIGSQTIGYGVRCGGREVFARPGTRPPAMFEGVFGARGYVVAGDGERALLLTVHGCLAATRRAVGALRSVRASGDALEITGADATFRWRP